MQSNVRETERVGESRVATRTIGLNEDEEADVLELVQMFTVLQAFRHADAIATALPGAQSRGPKTTAVQHLHETIYEQLGVNRSPENAQR